MVAIIETFYLIDYENVHSDGLSGCDKLSETDYIHLFYTENARTIDLDIFDNHGKAKLETHKVPAGNQSADMHIVSYLGYIIGINNGKDCSYVIVSQDTDFDKVIKFLNEKTTAKVSRFTKVNQPAAKKTTTPKQQTAAKASPTQAPKKVNAAEKTKLNQAVQQALSKANYANEVISNVAKIVASHFGEENILSNVHNALREEYEDYLEIYGTIKGVISKSTPAANKIPGQDKTALNSEIQQVLSKAGVESEVINDVASIVVKNVDVKNSKQQIYRTIISKYGQKKGLNIYNHIKKHIY